METIDKNQLNDRTRLRNDSLWITLDWGGLMTPLAVQQAVLDSLGRPGIENFMAVSDETWGIKEYQRDRTSELEQFGINQDRQIADDKAATGRAKLALQRVVDEYILAVKIYDSKVRALLMGAKEYAAQVELEQLAVALSGAILAVAKEGLHQKQVNASIYYEYIQRAMVEADIAKAQVEVAKAHVRAVLADISAGEADIKVITAQIEQYMAQAQKADLQASVAMDFAEILTKKLSAVKLGIGQAEIAAEYGYIQSKLDDALVLYGTKKLIEGIRIDTEAALKVEADLTLAVEEAEQDLRNLETDYARLVLAYEEGATWNNISQEAALKQSIVVAKKAVNKARANKIVDTDEAETSANKVVNKAREKVYKGSKHCKQERVNFTEYISGEE